MDVHRTAEQTRCCCWKRRQAAAVASSWDSLRSRSGMGSMHLSAIEEGDGLAIAGSMMNAMAVDESSTMEATLRLENWEKFAQRGCGWLWEIAWF